MSESEMGVLIQVVGVAVLVVAALVWKPWKPECEQEVPVAVEFVI